MKTASSFSPTALREPATKGGGPKTGSRTGSHKKYSRVEALVRILLRVRGSPASRMKPRLRSSSLGPSPPSSGETHIAAPSPRGRHGEFAEPRGGIPAANRASRPEGGRPMKAPKRSFALLLSLAVSAPAIAAEKTSPRTGSRERQLPRRRSRRRWDARGLRCRSSAADASGGSGPSGPCRGRPRRRIPRCRGSSH